MKKDWHKLEGVGWLHDGPEGTAMAIPPDGEERNERLDVKRIIIVLGAVVLVLSAFYFWFQNYGPRPVDVAFSDGGSIIMNEIACQHIMYEHNVSTSRPNFSCSKGTCVCHFLKERD